MLGRTTKYNYSKNDISLFVCQKGEFKRGFFAGVGMQQQKEEKNKEGRGFEGERKGVRVLIFLQNGRPNNIGFGSNLMW